MYCQMEFVQLKTQGRTKNHFFPQWVLKDVRKDRKASSGVDRISAGKCGMPGEVSSHGAVARRPHADILP